jgi:hypothetical protein
MFWEMEETMDSKLTEKIERLEAQLPRWEKWLYVCYSAAFVMLAQAFIKAHENYLLADALFFIEKKAGVIPSNGFFTPPPPDVREYYINLNHAMISNWRIALWLIILFLILACAAILAFHPAWRKIALAKRLDLIFGFLLAAWINFLSLGAQDLLNIPGEYNVLVVVYLLALGIGYWWQGRKKDKAEEVFP